MDLENLGNRLQRINLREAVEKDKLVIGLDFGTTFSGVAYAFTTDPDHVECIKIWPGADGKVVPKAPTVIKYDDSSKDKFKWGYEIGQTVTDKIEGIKLLLDPDQQRPLYAPDTTQAELDAIGKPVIDVVTDYMRAIHQHSLREIEKSYMADYIKGYEKQYVLSVPAVWSDKAKDMTLRAAKNAGMGPIDLIKEPEAAALYTLHFNRNKGLQVGDAIIVCDCGGGTVDLISYEVVGLTPLALKELAPSSGGLSGSLMLNKRFEQWLQSTVGEEQFVELKKTRGYQIGMTHFDSIVKPDFNGKNDPDKYVNFPMSRLKDNRAKGVDKDSVIVKGSTMFNIFDPLVRDIDKLITEQVNKVRIKRLTERHPKGEAVKAIFLVGGFGSSQYLREAIAESQCGIQVIQPPNAWSAIVMGTVMSKLPQEAAVLSNVAEKHYGTSCNSTYEPSRDKGQPLIVDKWEGYEKCEIMQWFIHKDDELVREKRIALEFYRKFTGHSPQGEELEVEDELFESSALLAPIHPDNPSVKVNCVLRTDLNKVPKHHFLPKKRKSDGEPYCELHYKLLVEIQSGPLKFSLEVDEMEYSAVEADY